MTNAAVHIEGQQPSLHIHVSDALASGATHAKGQQHPIKLYLVVWGWLFVLSTGSYLVDYFGLHGYLRWSLILLFMVLKAGLIVAVFMHMAWERLALAYAILLPPVLVLVFVAIMVFESDYTHLIRVISFGAPTKISLLPTSSASYQKESGYDHIRHARKLDRSGRAESEGLATPSGRGEEGARRYER